MRAWIAVVEIILLAICTTLLLLCAGTITFALRIGQCWITPVVVNQRVAQRSLRGCVAEEWPRWLR